MKPTKHSCCDKCSYAEYSDLGFKIVLCNNSACECHKEPTTAQDYAGPSGVQAACGCPTKHCEHYESDFDRFVKETDWSEVEAEFGRKFINLCSIVLPKDGGTHRDVERTLEVKDFIRPHLEAAREEGLAASSSDAQDGAYQNGLIAGRKEGLKEALGLVRK